MTMAHERTRALQWGRESLADIGSDETVDGLLRSRAQQILQRYPEYAEIHNWAKGHLGAMATASALALAEAAALFCEVGSSGSGTALTRRNLLYTRRHFPNAREFERWTKVLPASPLTGWLS